MTSPSVKGVTGSVDLVQQYITQMEDIISHNFFRLAQIPNYLYVMMSTMEQESHFKILHGSPATANHTEVVKPQSSTLGRSYWEDPVIKPLKFSDNIKDPLNVTLVEGLTAKALMGTMGMYQIRNTREHKTMCYGQYQKIAEDNGIIVAAGSSPAAVFTNDITGARRSMIMGCIIMENHFIAASKYFTNPQDALLDAARRYVGVGPLADKRRDVIRLGVNSTGRVTVIAQRVSSGTLSGSGMISESKTTTVASTNNVRVDSNGCGKA
jgi:hypothetical protein